MAKPVELLIYLFGFLSGSIVNDLLLKVLFTTVAMFVATTISHFWKRGYLDKRFKKRKKKRRK